MCSQDQQQSSENRFRFGINSKRNVHIIVLCAVAIAVTVLIVFLLNAFLSVNNSDGGTEVSENSTEESSLIPGNDQSDISDSGVNENGSDPTVNNESDKHVSVSVRPSSPIEGEIADGDITCDDFGNFSGRYVEDGKDEPVENVAAVLVTNRSEKFLDIAEIAVDINGKTATFIVTGLPAGSSAWVLEANRMSIGETAHFEFIECTHSFRDNAIKESDAINITADGNMLTATNTTQKTLKDVCVYYRTVHSDGNYLGGITYTVSFGDLEQGGSATVLAGHYKPESSEIVRISWQ